MNEPKRWVEFLNETIAEKASIQELRKFFAYCLTQDTQHQKALLLIGPGGNGKSVVLNILQKMVGEENCSHVSMKEFSELIYRAKLKDKLLNVSTELEGTLLSWDIFKAIVSGDKIPAAFSHQAPFIFQPFCKMVFETNQYPQILNTNKGLFRKFIIIKMKKRTHQDKPDFFLMDKLRNELPAISMWAKEGLKLLERDGFSQSNQGKPPHIVNLDAAPSTWEI